MWVRLRETCSVRCAWSPRLGYMCSAQAVLLFPCSISLPVFGLRKFAHKYPLLLSLTLGHYKILNSNMSEIKDQTIEVDPTIIEDVEDDYDDDDDDVSGSASSGSTMTLMSAARIHVFENGRRFHGWREVYIIAPSDLYIKNV